MEITDQEYKHITKEIGDRLRDIAFLNAGGRIEKEFSKSCIERYLDKDAEVEISYEFTFLVNDLRQILGRLRRGENIDEKS